jgi:predicted RNase H-like HicB family nuclease
MKWLLLTKEKDGRWFGEVPSLPGVLAYGTSEEEAKERTLVLARQVFEDRLEHDEPVPEFLRAKLRRSGTSAEGVG